MFQLKVKNDTAYVNIEGVEDHTKIKEMTRVLLNQYTKIIVTTDQKENIPTLKHNGYEVTSDGSLLKRKEVIRGNDITCQNGEKEIVLAGGCFWGTERVFQMLEGTRTVVGYANGKEKDITYGEVCEGNTGYQEAVKVVYDPQVTPLEIIMQAHFMTIHAEQENGQGNDIGEQYKTGIYYTDEDDRELLEKLYQAEKAKHTNFYPSLSKLESFVVAEEYHQNYLIKNPNGYCHISKVDLEKVKQLNRGVKQ